MGELGREIKRVEEEVPNLVPEKLPEEQEAPAVPERKREKVPVQTQTEVYVACLKAYNAVVKGINL